MFAATQSMFTEAPMQRTFFGRSSAEGWKLVPLLLVSLVSGGCDNPASERPQGADLRIDTVLPLDRFKIGEGIIRFEANNVSKQPFFVMRWVPMLPAAGRRQSFLSIKDETGKPLGNEDCILHDFVPTPRHYSVVEPGKRMVWSTRLQCWDFSQAREGVITMRAHYQPDNSACTAQPSIPCFSESVETAPVRMMFADGHLTPLR